MLQDKKGLTREKSILEHPFNNEITQWTQVNEGERGTEVAGN